MKFSYSNLNIFAENNASRYAAELFSNEIFKRTSVKPNIVEIKENAFVAFVTDGSIEDKDTFIITESNGTLTVTAKTIRGLIFG